VHTNTPSMKFRLTKMPWMHQPDAVRDRADLPYVLDLRDVPLTLPSVYDSSFIRPAIKTDASGCARRRPEPCNAPESDGTHPVTLLTDNQSSNSTLTFRHTKKLTMLSFIFHLRLARMFNRRGRHKLWFLPQLSIRLAIRYRQVPDRPTQRSNRVQESGNATITEPF
jgi:hypothetical protein